MPFNREILAAISFESGPLSSAEIAARRTPTEEPPKNLEVKSCDKRDEPRQNEATINLIRCMKWALGQSITSISHPAKQRPLNPKRDFSIKTKINLDVGVEKPKPGFCCSTAAATGVREQRNHHAPFYDAHGDSEEASHLDESDVESHDEVPNVPLAFVDYSPMCYRHIREFFNIDHRAYRDVLLRSRWHSTPTPGKSAAQLFFCGRDWVIKTMTHEESKFLRRILHRYYFFVLDHPYTLLPHFVGHHRLEINGEKMYIIIMQNVFVTGNTIHEKYDLKGSTVGRFATEAEKKKQTCTQKDLDINRPLHVGATRRNLLIEQMKMDCGFLNQCNIMDYSFLVGIHVLPMYEAHRPAPSTGSREYLGGAAALATSTLEPSYLLGMGETMQSMALNGHPTAAADSAPTDGRCFKADQGGMMSADHPGGRREIYYIGIIDILQEYNSRKSMETLVFGMLKDRQKISAVPPKEYAARFVSFVSSIIV
ncbi:phosphatidylinositol 4-phosphate 5-kinase alpha,putative [Trypanosoma brucei gambiense DAL972]|uniref:Phosphatidylinositol 4-phosphate 5-kinase alpha,putative n=2 Tax=Trypanosoma brucei TaxID=5691 RepID=C9ZM20_TRYB9|nr:phosphatidylinositol 4-phosphate 5-kinase alpha,putative [Trypanosoma brucei gambiense DAL972]CBH10445.1 phosphatidylinositol 4-phosphate 5-kinase alpha,putative [Trypanosoma brucei gambiense DAL972]|eukprot:XP_011772735.1 phosphatidylinositol 4-phosphate 5-kinase alpha,putative [Trypanosoma brucei gambiense DAL972]